MADLYGALGVAAQSNINLPGFGSEGNACASRLSVAFNKAGVPINIAIASAIGAQEFGAANGSRIIFRVSDFRKYLMKLLANPAATESGRTMTHSGLHSV